MTERARPQPIKLLMTRACEVTPREYWKALPLELRVKGVEAALRQDHGEEVRLQVRDALFDELKGFRPTVIAKWSDAELLRFVGKIARPSNDLMHRVVTGYFLFADPTIQSDFFELAGLAPSPDSNAVELREPATTPDAADRAAAALLSKRGASADTVAYLLGLTVLYSKKWPSIGDYLESLASGQVDGEESEQSDSPSSATATSQADPDEDAGLRALVEHRTKLAEIDETIFNVVVESSGEGETAPSRATTELIVRQFIRLNPRRHQSYYVLGLFDGVFNLPVAERIPAENEARRRWYSAGWILGRTRVNDAPSIVDEYLKDGRLRALGDGGAATEYCAPQVAQALQAAGRHAEAARFLDPRAFAVCGHELAASVLAWTSELLREERAREARPYLTVLEDGLLLRAELGVDTPPEYLPNAQRRLAHCLRHEGAFDTSKRRLQELLATQLNPTHQAMVSADIGLMDSGFNRLSAIPIPKSQSEATDIVSKLERGLPLFEKVAKSEADERSHGEYPLGVVRLLRDDPAGAFPLLERSMLAFQRDADRYRIGKLLERSQFYAALAGLQMNEEPLRAEQCTEWLLEGLKCGLRIPEHSVEQVLTGALMKHEPSAARIAVALLEQDQAAFFDVVARLAVPGAERLLAVSLLRSFTAGNRRTIAEAQLLRRALELARKAGDYETADAVLGALDTLATDGVASVEYLAVLASDELSGGIWDSEERMATRVTLLERSGRYAEAAALLADVFHTVLSGERYDAANQAAALVGRMTRYGPIGVEVARTLQDRLEAAEVAFAAQPKARPSQPAYRATIVIVGGNETQQQYEASLVEWGQLPENKIDLKFIWSGWGSNWNKYLTEFERMRATIDGIVILRFTRTEFGRAVRKRCDGKPQLGTWGHGQQSLKLAAARVAKMVRDAQRTQSTG